MIDAQERTSNIVYDRIAATYGLQFDVNFTQLLKYLLLSRFVQPTDICLDVGVANGIFALPLAPHVQAIHGVDISPNMLEECRRNIAGAGLTNVYVYERSATDLQFPDAAFDVVYSFSTLLLVPHPERAYREIARVLKPGGIALLDITGKHNLSRIHWGRYYRQQGHFGVNSHTLDDIRATFAGLGFTVLETHASGFLDQWKYIPLLNRLAFLEKIMHRTPRRPDLDYRVSQWVPRLANRWYFVLRKRTDE